MGVVLVGGIHAVGKTTTIERARQLTEKDAPLLKGSDILARYLGVTPEEIPYVDPKKRALARVAMYEELARATNGIRDCHFCTYSSEGYEFPFETDTNIGTAAIAVVLETSPEAILMRRLHIERDRPKDITIIREQLGLERSAATRAAVRLGVKVLTIRNDDGEGEAASSKLAEVFNAYLY